MCSAVRAAAVRSAGGGKEWKREIAIMVMRLVNQAELQEIGVWMSLLVTVLKPFS